MNPSYNLETNKNLSYIAFKKLHEGTEYFKLIDEDHWEAEYEKATGKKVDKKIKIEKAE